MSKQMIDVSTYGFEELDKQLDEFTENVQKKLGKKAAKIGAKPLQAAINAEAPVGETGKLSTASQIKVSARKGKVTARVQITPKDAPGVTQVQYGTSRQDANPFMTRATDKTKEEVVQQVAEGYREEIEKEWKRVAKRNKKKDKPS